MSKQIDHRFENDAWNNDATVRLRHLRIVLTDGPRDRELTFFLFIH